MIRFVSAKDEFQSGELVGKLVMRVTKPEWPAFRHPCRVVQHTPDAIVVSRLLGNYSDKEAIWLFTDRIAGDHQVMDAADIGAICDTVAEVNTIILKSREAIGRFYELRDRIAAEFLDLPAAHPPQDPGQPGDRSR